MLPMGCTTPSATSSVAEAYRWRVDTATNSGAAHRGTGAAPEAALPCNKHPSNAQQSRHTRQSAKAQTHWAKTAGFRRNMIDGSAIWRMNPLNTPSPTPICPHTLPPVIRLIAIKHYAPFDRREATHQTTHRGMEDIEPQSSLFLSGVTPLSGVLHQFGGGVMLPN